MGFKTRTEVPLLYGTATAPVLPYLLAQAFGGDRTLSIRRGDWKCLDHLGSGGNNHDSAALKPFALSEAAPGAPGRLYDLANDPGETTNLYFQHPEIVARLKALLERSKSSGRSRP